MMFDRGKGMKKSRNLQEIAGLFYKTVSKKAKETCCASHICVVFVAFQPRRCFSRSVTLTGQHALSKILNIAEELAFGHDFYVLSLILQLHGLFLLGAHTVITDFPVVLLSDNKNISM